ncbi:sensor histidine kinase KdpD [Massilia sp. H6]|uniref:sensor histidine kinase n=1 Tax=Massilia sp. H6 TaxID=2970464 RepID=UPI00216797C8|nr:PAS domain-containing sensor histidine kinase [Massilia sp. H6]UVW29810.1 ATP-binding protein [Massilia sp. H6]
METRQRQLADYLPEAVYSCDLEGRVIDFNRAAEVLWGRAPALGAEYWCGSKALFTAQGVALRHDECPMALALRERREVGRIEAMLERPGGERRYVLAHPRLIHDAHGQVAGAVNVVIDITERRLAENQLLESHLRKDAFISTVAHELRSPLSPIMSAAQMIETTDSPDTMKRMAGVITRQARMLGRLVNDLFDASRIARGDLPLHKAAVPFQRVLLVALDMARPSIDLRHQRLSIAPLPESLMVDCDDVRVAQLIGNILANASKYTPHHGAIDVAVALAGKVVIINISDDGIGIEPGRLSEIFTLYAQIDHQDSARQGGMGIGLALALDLARRHGGTIEAFSDGPGQGSRFEIRLPIALH